jgi:hypothetical protein
MLEKGKEFHWSMDCQHAFDVVKEKLGKETKLQLPDFSKPFRLACDASGVAIGAVLSQLDEDGKEKPIAFASKVMSKTRDAGQSQKESYMLCIILFYILKDFYMDNHSSLFQTIDLWSG